MNSSNDQQYNDLTGDYIVPRRTPVACQFCRGRKLKCDGRQTCANCAKRSIPCVYMSVSDQLQRAGQGS